MATRRSIVHMDLDTFFVSCERLLDSRLHHKPILIGGTSERGVVASCSYEARRFGVHSGMSMKMAKERCPEAICIKGNTQTTANFPDSLPTSLKRLFRSMKKCLSTNSTSTLPAWIAFLASGPTPPNCAPASCKKQAYLSPLACPKTKPFLK